MVSRGEAEVSHRHLRDGHPVLNEERLIMSISEAKVLLICHRCRLVHSEAGGWMTKQTYRDTTGIDPLTCRLTHTYCPFCYDFLMNHSKAA